MIEQVLAAARAGRDASLEALVEELRIPSVSTLPEHRDDCRRNANWLVGRLEGLGFEASLTDVLDDGHPVLRADLVRDPAAPTLTIYGHYDVQPPEPLDEWTSPPFEPRISEGVLFARGCADNKGNHMAAIEAVRFWTEADGPPCNVRFLIEGEEEIGGESLPIFVERNSEDLATDLVVLWDGGFSSDGQPSLCVGLRGLLYVELVVDGTARDLHSGGFGGVAPNAADALAQIVAALHDESRAVSVPGFYDDVRVPDEAELAKWHRDPDGAARFRELMGTDVVGEPGYSIEERLWTRPTLEVNGLYGGFTGEGAKTVIPARATAKLSMRLVPDQRPQEILDALRAYVEKVAPPGVRTEVRSLTATPAVLLGADHSGAQEAMKAWEAATDKPCVLVRTGGSIPVVGAFDEFVRAPMIISGVATKDSAAHAPNERLYLENYYAGIDMMIRLMDTLTHAGR